MPTEPFSRRRDDAFFISSDRTLLSPSAITAAFASDAMYWCKPLPLARLRICLDNSFCLGLYLDRSASHPPALATPPAPEQIGFLRLVTDYTTFAYLTDVYVLPEHQGKGLGKWLIKCVDEVLGGMADLRGAMLYAAEGNGQRFYEKELGFSRVEQGKDAMCVMYRLGDGAMVWKKSE